MVTVFAVLWTTALQQQTQTKLTLMAMGLGMHVMPAHSIPTTI